MSHASGTVFAKRRARWDKLLRLIEENPAIKTRELAAALGASDTSIRRDLRKLGLPSNRARNDRARVSKRLKQARRYLKKLPTAGACDLMRKFKCGACTANNLLRACDASKLPDNGLAQATQRLERIRRARKLLDANPDIGVKQLARRIGVSARTGYDIRAALRAPESALRTAEDAVLYARARGIFKLLPEIGAPRLTRMLKERAPSGADVRQWKIRCYLNALRGKESTSDAKAREIEEALRKNPVLTYRALIEQTGATRDFIHATAKERGLVIYRDDSHDYEFDRALEARAIPLPQSVLDEIREEFGDDLEPPVLPPEYQERYLKCREARKHGLTYTRQGLRRAQADYGRNRAAAIESRRVEIVWEN